MKLAEKLREIRKQSLKNNSIERRLLIAAENDLEGICVDKIFDNNLIKDLEEKGFTVTHSNTNTFITF